MNSRGGGSDKDKWMNEYDLSDAVTGTVEGALYRN